MSQFVSLPVLRRLLLAACATCAAVAAQAADPAWPTDGWETMTPAEAGMKQSLLAQARDYAQTGGGAGTITRSGWRVFTWGNQGQRFDLKSTTKSIGVTALGLALQDDLLALSDKARTHLPGIGKPPQSNADTGWLGDITILQLATHTAGFDKPGGFIDLLFEPGTVWSYSDGGANWLADTLTVLYGADLNAVMFERVFDPLGIRPTDLSWRSNLYRGDKIDGIKRREFGSGISASVDAMARIGYLYLRHGAWEGGRILPADFVATVSKPAPSLAGLPVSNPGEHAGASDHYGLLWWNNGDGSLANVPVDAFWSWGLKDSFIIVVPSLELVIARAGDGWRQGWDSNYSVLEPFLDPIARAVNGVTLGRPPAVQIDSPGDGIARDAGTAIDFEGRASDADEGNLTHELRWASDRDGPIGSGGSFSTSSLSVGTHLVTASVTDSGGLVGTANVIVEIRGTGGGGGAEQTLPAVADSFTRKFSPDATAGSKPIMRVHGPNEKKLSFVQFDVTALSGPVSAASLELWVKDVPDAGVVDVHAVLAGWSEQQLTHNNRPPYGATPVASLAVGPADEGRYVSVDVTALVQQWADSPASAFGIALTSQDLHAVFQTREGTHAPVIEVTVGESGNAKPDVTITAPADGTSVPEGDSLSFAGTAMDAEEGTLSSSLTWTSSIDGVLGSGESFSSTMLSVGTHTVTASVADGGGAVGSDSIQVMVQSAGGSSLTFEAVADTFSHKGKPGVNFGDKNYMRTHGPNDKKTGFVRFDLESLVGSSVASAVVKLYVSKMINPGRLDVHAVQADWVESTLTHNNKPPYAATPVASLALGVGDAGNVVSLDITSLVQEWADSPASAFGIALSSADLHAQFQTREAANPPAVEIHLN